MRTKTLLLTAALSAAGIASSLGQVYSVNSVGYVNVTIPEGPGITTFALTVNPLNNGGNTVAEVLPDVPNGTQIFKFTSGAFESANTFIFGSWDNPNQVIAPGDGFFIGLDNGEISGSATITFVGEVPQGQLSNPLPAGFSIRGSQVPQAGLLTMDLGFPDAFGDQVFKFDRAAQSYSDAFTSFGGGAWDPTEPTLDVGESAFVFKDTASSWDRDFSVN